MAIGSLAGKARGAMVRPLLRGALLASSAACLIAGGAYAQETPQPQAGPDEGRDVVVIVGSQIVGAQVSEALPVTVIGREEIDALAVSSGDDLFRSIPQLGDVNFNSGRTVGSVNDARGDTASINLRSLGTGNTLVLLNGRRLVNHPGTQAENLVPVVTANTNSLPVMGIERVEVLLDGASAIYGADAVAGVVNTVLKTDFTGFTAELQYGKEDGVDADELSGSFELGVESDDGRTNVSVFGSYYGRDPIFASERAFTANADNRSRLPASWQTDAAAAEFNGTSLTSAWGIFDRFTTGNITVNGVAVTNANGQFHIQPSTLAGCLAQLGNGICIDDTLTRDQELRYNVNEPVTVQNGVDRYNLFTFLNHDLTDTIELFAEGGVYLAETVGYRESAPMLGAVPIVVPRTNYYNPFGPTGSPNRLANTNAPAAGLDLVLGGLGSTSAYRPIDAGPRKTVVENIAVRGLAGLRGEIGDWNWESAVLWTKANTVDRENRISNTLFQQQLGLATPDAYNPFNGGCVNALSSGDCTRSNAAAIAAITVPVFRRSETSLTSWDFKISRPDLFTIWGGGEVGVAAGVELRREDYKDDRDGRQDGGIQFTDIINTALATTNDLQGNNPSLDIKGERDVGSAYIEFAVPVVSPDMGIPLVQNVDLQLAARYENFDTFGDVTKPKVALSWRPFDFLLFRSAWSEGFRAPNLQQQYETGLLRSNNRTDYIRCEAARRQNRIASFTTNCPTVTGSSLAVTSNRQGSTALQPEESENLTYGMVLESTFLPPEYGKVTFTADWWQVEQDGVIGVFSDTNHILLDYVLRVQAGANCGAGCGNPAVIRGPVDAQDQADFNNTGLTAIGDIVLVNDNYINLDKRKVIGLDFGLYYAIDDTALGDFSFRVNAAYLDKFFQAFSPRAQTIVDAANAGQIPSVLRPVGAGTLIRQGGRPEWRWTSSATWRNGAWGVGWFTSYVGDVEDFSGVVHTNGSEWIVDSYQTHNLYVQYEFGRDTDKPMRVRLGMRNITDEEPPLTTSTFGYSGELHSPQGRFLYASVRKEF